MYLRENWAISTANIIAIPIVYNFIKPPNLDKRHFLKTWKEDSCHMGSSLGGFSM